MWVLNPIPYDQKHLWVTFLSHIWVTFYSQAQKCVENIFIPRDWKVKHSRVFQVALREGVCVGCGGAGGGASGKSPNPLREWEILIHTLWKICLGVILTV